MALNADVSRNASIASLPRLIALSRSRRCHKICKLLHDEFYPLTSFYGKFYVIIDYQFDLVNEGCNTKLQWAF